MEINYKFNLTSDSNIQLVDTAISASSLDSSIGSITTFPEQSYLPGNGLSSNDTSVPVCCSSLLNGSPTLAINENINESTYSRRFWKTNLVPKGNVYTQTLLDRYI